MELTFDDFRERAKDKSLSAWEKIGFPDSYRMNSEARIFEDIFDKLKLGGERVRRILDIGCGCSPLVNYFIDFSVASGKEITIVDSEEMIESIRCVNMNSGYVSKVPGKFPEVELTGGGYDAICIYSVIQYPFQDQSIFKFIHSAINVLNPGGRLLIGDIPNLSSRKRFLESDAGREFQSNVGVAQLGNVSHDHEDQERLDDAVVLSIISRFRNFGHESYILPQAEGLPFANRREDILIIKR